MSDIFDEITDEKDTDIFDRIDIFDRMEEDEPKTDDVKTIVEKELARMKPLQQVVVREIRPEIKEVVIKERFVEAPKKEEKKYADEKSVEQLKSELKELKKMVEETREILPMMGGGSGVIGLPQMQSKSGSYLTNDGNSPVWSTLNPVPIGDQNTDGSWRIVVSGSNLSFQRRESGSWVEKMSANP